MCIHFSCINVYKFTTCILAKRCATGTVAEVDTALVVVSVNVLGNGNCKRTRESLNIEGQVHKHGKLYIPKKKKDGQASDCVTHKPCL